MSAHAHGKLWKIMQSTLLKFSTQLSLSGPEPVVGIVMDNESKMHLMWNLVEEANQGFIALACSAHIGSLLMKDIPV